MTHEAENPKKLLPVYMAQKVILLTRILNLTREIEVRSRQSEIKMDDVIERRQLYLDRLAKCHQMIGKTCAALPAEQCERQKKILAGRLPTEECSPEETHLLQLGAQCGTLLQKTLATDREARERLQCECDRARRRIADIRKEEAAKRQKHPAAGA